MPHGALPHLLQIIVGLELQQYADEHISNEEMLVFLTHVLHRPKCLAFLSAVDE